MEFEDSRNALFVEPNAYIQKYDCEKKEIKKVIFQEPYECLPNYYINNNFIKGDCNCVKQHKDFCKDKSNSIKKHCDCEQPNNKNNSCSNTNFDLKNFLPLLAGLNKGGMDFSSITNMLSNGGGFNFSSIMQSFIKNPNGIGNILNLFKGKNKKENLKTPKEIKSTDFPIKNYTRVE